MSKNSTNFKSSSGSKSSTNIKSSSNIKTDSTSSIDRIGTVLNDNYIIFKKLGSGSFSTVWLAFSQKLNKCVAIKILNHEDNDSGLKELNIMKKINKNKKKYFVKFIDNFMIGNDDVEQLCIVMDLLSSSVYECARMHKKNGNLLDVETVRSIIKNCLLALKELHKNGIIHSDIKLENILIQYDGYKNKGLVDLINGSNIPDMIRNVGKEYSKKGDKFSGDQIIEDVVRRILLISDNVIGVGNVADGCTESCDVDDFSNSSDSDKSETHSKYMVNRNAIIYDDELDGDKDEKNDGAFDKLGVKYIETKVGKIKVKLADMGTCVYKNECKYNLIQTRHYRAPEVILGIKYDEKCDVWSVGCCMYELLTNKILFNPSTTKTTSTDRNHIKEIVEKIGVFPNEIINSSPKKEIFFKKNLTVRGFDDIGVQFNLAPIWNEFENSDAVDLLRGMLNIDLCKRFSVDDCLNHRWLCLNA